MVTSDHGCGCADDGRDKRHKFVFKVDEEALTAFSEGDTAELSVRTVLDMSGNQPPDKYYLVEFTSTGHKERVEHRDLDKVLVIKSGARFAAVFSGCTPVSDKGVEELLGVKRLKAELEAVGVNPQGPVSSGGLEWLIIDGFNPPGGRFLGTPLSVAVAVPADFPQTPPGGIYVSPKVFSDGEMGSLNIHYRPEETAGLPGERQYWSRPIPPDTWTPSNPGRRLLAHWNAVMANV